MKSNLLQKLSNFKSIFTNHSTRDEYEFDEDNDEMDEDGDPDQDESDEDTEEASETEIRKIETVPAVPDRREQMYLDKLGGYRVQLAQLLDGKYPEYLRKVRKLEAQYKERLRLNHIWKDHEIEITEKDFVAEKKSAIKDHEEKTIELKENLIQEMEEKKKLFEQERITMELSGDSTESKPAMTRKLRRRPNDPAPVPEKQRRGKLTSLPTSICYLLDEKEIEMDLKAIARGIKSGVSVRKPANGLQSLGPIIPDPPSSDIRIEDGKLLYDKKWFHRGQTIFVEGKDLPKFPAIISAIGSEAISVKKTSDSSKTRIYLSQLVRGKITIKRRAS